MTPFDGQRRLEVRAEQVVWHLVSAGVLGLLLLALLLTIALLDGAAREAQPSEGKARVARPIEGDGTHPATYETSTRCEPAGSVVPPGEAEPSLARRRDRPVSVRVVGA